jgi:ABC-type Mn2+/Zn2+ transport system permease subunit
MTELLGIFWPTLLAAAATASALAFVGALLVSRKSTVQVLAVGQGAGLGVLVGLAAAMHFLHDDHLEHTTFPLITGIFFSALVFSGLEKLARAGQSKTVIHLSAFAALWALTHLLTGFFPSLEAQSGALFFGDIVTLSRPQAFLFFSISLLSLSFLLYNRRILASTAFDASILGESLSLSKASGPGFYLICIVLICLSVQALGLLFTVSALFIPTGMLSLSRRVGVQRHLLSAVLLGFLASSAGFLLSLLDPRLGTTPVITVALLLGSGLWVLISGAGKK